MKKILPVSGILILLACSCELFDFDAKKPDRPQRKFWAQNIKTGDFYQVNAALLAEGLLCNVWVERGSGVNANTARQVADAYDNDIYQKMIDTFSIVDFEFNGLSFSDIMEFANWMGNNGGKLCILLLDIKDDYRNVNDPYVAGYFWSGNFFDVRNSNRCAMIYIDTRPGKPGSLESNATLAHEMQHLMNFLTTIIMRAERDSGGRITMLNQMDIWIDEGLSEAAGWVYAGNSYSQKHKEWFNENGDGKEIVSLIDQGNNFFVWGNRWGDGKDENPHAILDDYTTAYLFFQWLRLQAGGNDIYKKIISSEDYNYEAVVKIINAEVPGDYGFSGWETLLRAWMAANYINAPAGPYGYMSDPVLKDIKAPYAPAGITNLPLVPGEGVYSKIPGSQYTIPGPQGNIRYAGLNMENANLGDTNIDDGALLTYNINTVKSFTFNGAEWGAPENGTTTGIAGDAITQVSGAAYGSRSAFGGPFPIGAGDMLRRNNHGVVFYGKDLPGLMKGIGIDK